VAPLEQNLHEAQRAFSAGATSYLNVLESTRRLVDARKQQLELEADVRRASAELARSVGRDFDAH
jgi:cobalt-zinc-cadmium efflux system outer membrane protein